MGYPTLATHAKWLDRCGQGVPMKETVKVLVRDVVLPVTAT